MATRRAWAVLLAAADTSGAVYDVMGRGDRREPIYGDDQDRLLFLDTLAEACEKTDWQVHAWCLMSNHFHLVSETPRGNLVHGMQWLLGVYTNRFNHRHKEFGHLFQRSLQGAAGGWVREWLFEGGVRLRVSEGSPAVSFSEGPAGAS